MLAYDELPERLVHLLILLEWLPLDTLIDKDHTVYPVLHLLDAVDEPSHPDALPTELPMPKGVGHTLFHVIEFRFRGIELLYEDNHDVGGLLAHHHFDRLAFGELVKRL